MTLADFRGKIGNIYWTSLFHCQCANEAYDAFMRIFITVYEECVRFKKVRMSNKKRKPWLSDECLRAIREKNALYRKFLKTRNSADFSALKNIEMRCQSY